jgi:hypothetical protein
MACRWSSCNACAPPTTHKNPLLQPLATICNYPICRPAASSPWSGRLATALFNKGDPASRSKYKGQAHLCGAAFSKHEQGSCWAEEGGKTETRTSRCGTVDGTTGNSKQWSQV